MPAAGADHARAVEKFAPVVLPEALGEVARQLHLIGRPDIQSGWPPEMLDTYRIAEAAAIRSLVHSVCHHPMGLLQALLAAESFAAVAVVRWRELRAALDTSTQQVIRLASLLDSHRAALEVPDTHARPSHRSRYDGRRRHPAWRTGRHPPTRLCPATPSPKPRARPRRRSTLGAVAGRRRCLVQRHGDCRAASTGQLEPLRPRELDEYGVVGCTCGPAPMGNRRPRDA